jgi:enoyl-CoA hydratase/carnithine racemase
MDYQHITCDLDGSCLIVTLNRPEKLNAYTGLMGAEIATPLDVPIPTTMSAWSS